MRKVKGISEYENTSLFLTFLGRIGFKNFNDYVNLFGDDVEKRKEAVRRFKKEYPYFRLNEQEKGKTL